MQSENMKDLNTSAMVAKDTYDKWYYNNVEWGDHEMHAPEQSIWLYPKSPYFNFPMKNRTTVNGMGKYERTPEEIVTSRTTYATREKDMLMQQFDIKEKITNNGVNTCIHQADVPEVTVEEKNEKNECSIVNKYAEKVNRCDDFPKSLLSTAFQTRNTIGEHFTTYLISTDDDIERTSGCKCSSPRRLLSRLRAFFFGKKKL